MFFDLHLRDIKGVPQFHTFSYKDVNPLSGHTKHRIIYDPNEPMREVHRRFIEWLRKLRIDMPNATGGIPGMSPVINVRRHKHYVKRSSQIGRSRFRRYFYLLDISNAYCSIDPGILAAILWKHNKTLPGDEKEVLKFLKRYCLDKEAIGLATGAPASPDLFNIYCEHMIDRKLRKLCEKYGIVYTRYIDDLTFSANRPIGRRKRQALREILLFTGFRLSDKKAQVLDLARGPITVNGVGIDLSGRTFLPQHAVKKLDGLLHLAINGRLENIHLVYGHMGIFKSVIDRRNLTATEKKILKKYEQFQQMTHEVEA